MTVRLLGSLAVTLLFATSALGACSAAPTTGDPVIETEQAASCASEGIHFAACTPKPEPVPHPRPHSPSDPLPFCGNDVCVDLGPMTAPDGGNPWDAMRLRGGWGTPLRALAAGNGFIDRLIAAGCGLPGSLDLGVILLNYSVCPASAFPPGPEVPWGTATLDGLIADPAQTPVAPCRCMWLPVGSVLVAWADLMYGEHPMGCHEEACTLHY